MLMVWKPSEELYLVGAVYRVWREAGKEGGEEREEREGEERKGRKRQVRSEEVKNE